MKQRQHVELVNGEYYGSSMESPIYTLNRLTDIPLNECKLLVELVRNAMLMSLIERGDLKLGFTRLKLDVDINNRLIVSRKEPFILDNLLEHNEDKYKYMDFLGPHHLKRLRLLKENLGNLQKDNSEQLQDGTSS